MRRIALLAVALAGCNGSVRLMSTACTTNADCPVSNDCREGICVPRLILPSRDAGCPECGLECGPRVACGQGAAAHCCARGEGCRGDVCVSGCAAISCDAGTVCLEELPGCVAPVVPQACVVTPAPGPWELVERWHYRAPDKYRHSIATPVVMDVDGDGAADVIALFFPDEGSIFNGLVRALSGVDGHLLWQTLPQFAPAAGIAIGDRDGQGHLTVFAMDPNNDVVRLDARTGAEVLPKLSGVCPRFSSQLWGPAWSSILLADKDEVGSALPYCGRASGYNGGMPVAFNRFGTGVEIFDAQLGEIAYGFPAVADLLDFDGRPGRDGHPELVMTGQGRIAIGNNAAPSVMLEALLPSWNGTECTTPSTALEAGGAPAIADFSGDGSAQIAVAGTQCLSVFGVDEIDGGAVLRPRWSRPIADLTSGVTGCSAFDFDDDGAAEVLHADETAFRIFDGKTGAERVKVPHCSATDDELPVVADLDGDGAAEIILVENTFAADIVGCDAGIEPGIRVLAEVGGRFANARPVWNQSTYHVTNVCDGEDLVCGGPFDATNRLGRIPTHERNSWDHYPEPKSTKPYNGYRLNVGDGFSSADLTVSAIAADERDCPRQLTLRARVENQGAHAALRGVLVEFHIDGARVATARTSRRLKPGESEIIRASWVPSAAHAWPVLVSATVNSDGRVRECEPANDGSPVIAARCD
jgi:hypothetical protein